MILARGADRGGHCSLGSFSLYDGESQQTTERPSSICVSPLMFGEK